MAAGLKYGKIFGTVYLSHGLYWRVNKTELYHPNLLGVSAVVNRSKVQLRRRKSGSLGDKEEAVEFQGI